MSKNFDVKKWILPLAVFGFFWSLYGLYQFYLSVNATLGSLTESGLSEAQANVMLAQPVWLKVSFFVGTFGGTVGSVLLGMGNRHSRLLLGVSLIAYLLLTIGDVVHGVFSALGVPHLIIITFVVVIAAVLYFASTKLEVGASINPVQN